MDTTFMTNIVTSGTAALTSLIGALFTFITSVLPVLLGLAAVGFVVWGIRRILRSFKSIRH